MIHGLRRHSLLLATARLSAFAASLLFAALAVAQGPPVSPEGPGIERDVQYVFVGIVPANRVAISPGSGVFARVEAAGRTFQTNQPHVRWQEGAKRLCEFGHAPIMPKGKAHGLAECVHARIGSPRCMGDNALGFQAFQPSFKLTLDGAVGGLLLPTGETSSVVLEDRVVGRHRRKLSDPIELKQEPAT